MSEQNKSAPLGWNLQHSYSELPAIFHSSVTPTPVTKPRLVVLNKALASFLGLNGETLASDENAELFSGNRLPEGASPIAQAYAGHQFGGFTMLGDGRAILLGEQTTPDGDTFDVQLKGSGPTPYSRRGDGRAALKPMLREYIISEAMNGLGIPTTRSLAVVSTGDSVIRQDIQPGAILTRVASSHIRVGTFEFARAHGQPEDLQALIEYTLIRHFPEGFASENPTLALLEEVISRQAQLVARWMHVGFIHGVMNTDNMSICGETIDYGPCAFMDTYNPATVFSSIDREGRYAYANQPRIALWNLERFAETLVPFLDDAEDKAVELAQNALEGFADQYNDAWLNGMRSKLGLFDSEEEDSILVTEFLGLLYKNKSDYTNSFRALTHYSTGFPDAPLFASAEFAAWNQKWSERRNKQHKSEKYVVELMRRHNPNVIARNHRVEEALSAGERGDLAPMERLLKVLASPFEDSAEHTEFSREPGPEFNGYKTFCGT
ncbi:MAG: hypothetical protein RI953_3030 [Pseudomonadota bacterium]|jgi:uncharacterized protein YdiU (UPF0061 family)